MKILLDTHIFLWAITDDSRLPAAYRDRFISEDNELFLSIGSLWEMVIKCGLGKLPLPTPVTNYLSRQQAKNRVGTLTIQIPHLRELETLPPLHRDPFDRLLIAQARSERMPILSVDPLIRRYDVAAL